MMIRGEAGAAVNREQFGNIHAVRAEKGRKESISEIFIIISTRRERGEGREREKERER